MAKPFTINRGAAIPPAGICRTVAAGTRIDAIPSSAPQKATRDNVWIVAFKEEG